MDELSIEIEQGQTSFLPGEVVSGHARWQQSDIPKQACIRLIWYTQGRGTEDADVIETHAFHNPLPSDNRRFEFKFPAGPYSFSGRLISLIWALELEVDGKCSRMEIVISPSGEEIALGGRSSN